MTVERDNYYDDTKKVTMTLEGVNRHDDSGKG